MSAADTQIDLGVLPYTFSIVGVQKAGTSTLSALLARHPQVTAPRTKELHYFDDESLDWSKRDHAEYVARRRAPEEIAAGDNTPKYIFHPHALERMQRYQPSMRLIALFRDPIERLFSHWAMLRERHAYIADWPAFITELRPRRIPTRFPKGAAPKRYIARSGAARGLYGQQLERGFALFPRDQWLLLEFRTMLADHRAALDLATDHLGLQRFSDHPPLVHRMSGPERVHGTPPTAQEIHDLADYYRDDLDVFARLSSIDVTGWPTARILAGTLDPAELAGRLASKVTASRHA